MNSSFGGGGGNNPPNPSTPFAHFQPKISSTSAHNGSSKNENNNNGRGRSQTDTALLLNKSATNKSASAGTEAVGQLEMAAAEYSTNQPYKQRLYELFSLIEREMEAMHMENCALRARLEMQSGADRPVNELLETPRKRGTDNLTSQMNETFQSFGNELEQKLSVGGTGKKSTQSRQQKWKSAFKNPSGKLALKVGANFPESSKHRFVQSFKGHTDGAWHVFAVQQQIGCNSASILASASADQSAKIWLAENGGQPLATYSGHNGSVNSIAARPYASSQLTFLTCSGDRSAHIWRLNLDQILERRREIHPENEDEHHSSLFVQQIHQPLLKLTGHSDAIMAADWLFGGEQIITVSWDRTANLFDAESGKVMKTLSGHDRELTSCSAHSSQKLLATASRDFTFRLWDFREPIHSVAVFQGHNDSVTSVLFSTQYHIVSGSDDRTVKVWDLRNMRSPISAIRLDSAANRIAICNQRNLLAIPMDNRNISVYDLNGNRQTRIPRSAGKCHHRLVTSCCWLTDHPVNNLITAGFDKQIIGWKVNLPPLAGTKN